jgi:protein gp37
MAEKTAIAWCDATFNPWIGCTRVSAGCQNCYAEADFDHKKGFAKWGPQGTRVVTSDANWKKPLKWDRDAKAAGVRARVFCASLADVFENWRGPMVNSSGDVLIRPHLDAENMPENWDACDIETLRTDPQGWKPVAMGDVRLRLFDLIRQTPNLDWLLLTKRPENVTAWIADAMNRAWGVPQKESPLAQWMEDWVTRHSVPANVWIGASVENQAAADARIPHLLEVPAAVRFLSCEPLLAAVDLVRYLPNTFTGFPRGPRVDWVIVGGESGPAARPMAVEWARSLVRQCKAAGVPVFMKQLGAVIHATNAIDPLDQFPCPTGSPRSFRQGPGEDTIELCLRDRKGGDPSEWPADLRVQEFPA